MPHKNPDKSSYMPIVQDYDQEIRPIIEEFDKNIQVMEYESKPMTEEERNAYTTFFEQKLKDRLVKKKIEYSRQSKLAASPNAMHSQQSKITNGQFYKALQYHSLVGVDLSQN